MKTTWKWLFVMALAAVTAHAGQEMPGEPPCGGAMPPPCGERMMPPPGGRGCPPPCMKGARGCPEMPPREACGGEPRHMGPTPEQREEFEAFRSLCKAVRAETDEAKKAELVEDLRAKLGKMAEEQCERQKAHLKAAEQRIAEQKARLDAQIEELRGRIEDDEAHRPEWIEEQVRCILAGERPPMRRMHRSPEGKGPDVRCGDRPGPHGGKKEPGRCGGQFGKPPCGEAGALPPPPPPEEEDGEPMPPPDGDMAE